MPVFQGNSRISTFRRIFRVLHVIMGLFFSNNRDICVIGSQISHSRMSASPNLAIEGWRY